MKLLSEKIASLALFRVMLHFSVYSELRKSFWAWGRVTIRPSGVFFSHMKNLHEGNSINPRLKSLEANKSSAIIGFLIFQFFCWTRRFINSAFRLKTFMEISLALNPRHKQLERLRRFQRSSRTDERNLIKLKLIDYSRVEWGTRLSQSCMQSTERSRAKWLLP